MYNIEEIITEKYLEGKVDDEHYYEILEATYDRDEIKRIKDKIKKKQKLTEEEKKKLGKIHDGENKKYYFLIAADTLGSDYIYLDNDEIPRGVRRAAKQSTFQFVERDLQELLLDDQSGQRIPDFICDPHNNVPLISDKMKRIFDECDIRYLFYKRVKLVRKKDGFSKRYWLAIPPRIDCIHLDKSCIDSMWNKATKITIDPKKVGNYDIFKISGVSNQEIIVTDHLKRAIEKKKADSGLFFVEDPNLN